MSECKYKPGDPIEVFSDQLEDWEHEGCVYVGEWCGRIVYGVPGWPAPQHAASSDVRPYDPNPVITLKCLTETPPLALTFEINWDDERPRLHVTIEEFSVVVPFDDVIDAVTELRDRSRR